MISNTMRGLGWGLALALAIAPLARAQETADGRVARLEQELARLAKADEENQRRQKILTEEVRKLREALVLPEKKELKAQYGVGPAASKVYQKEKGFSIGGYGQGWYTGLVNHKGANTNSVDLQRFVLYTGYKFNDRLVFNAEVEHEDATTEKGGSVSVEFAQMDFLNDPKLNFRAGILLLPIGFINQLHEPLFYHGNQRPEVERQIIPATWGEAGAGIFGKLTDEWDYQACVVSSMRASGFSGDNLREGRQGGAQALAEDSSLVLRSDYQITPELSAGGSVYSGNQGQGESFQVDAAGTMVRPDVHLNLWEAHAQYRSGGLQLRALGTRANVDDAGVLSAAEIVRAAAAGRPSNGPIGSRLSGAYVEAAYDLMPHFNSRSNQSLDLFVRREAFDTLDRVPAGFADDPSKDVRLTTVGLDYKPDPQIVLKLDYRIFDLGAGARPDEIDLGVGWIF
ncbi:MAG: hypothetical protein HY303_12240 [Candidatus Wallbacteria bacterium]|nr:hypothetical protein [Candidatus Wallbacteria bacterium]